MGTGREPQATPSEERNAARLSARRTQILDAATSVFARLGYHGSRMDDIVQASGLSKGAIYWYFKSKEEIAVELVRRLLHDEEESLAGAPIAEGDAGARLSAMADDFSRSLQENPARAPLALELLSLGQRIPAIKKHFTEYHGTYVALLSDLLRAASGGAAPERQIKAGALALAAMVDGWALHEALITTPSGHRDGLGQAVGILVAGLRSYG
ncbi:TetR/AcrR family transcriptional regulator [Streptomyces salinarius]|uniref:TetR/AcrR family transcriptional regulator n=1 Tax=Streptomyces salinarius TaxID=2762598 RepID=UPI001645DD2A|nr:TetR/AcrR family transcriptional regulator [Streptomyces salinarius]